MTFEELGIDEKLLEGLSYMGFEEATPIQEESIPKIMAGEDVLACAQTGTGKTAAFILPVLHKLAQKKGDYISALVIVPTRELALQVEQQVQAFAYFVDASSMAVYGGGDGIDFEQQKRALKLGADIIVATPGKLISHLQMKYVDLSKLDFLILDEADRMLDMGFFEDIQYIISHCTRDRQSLLFSATMPPQIRQLAKKMLKNPSEITIAISKPAEGVLQGAYLAYDEQKPRLIRKLIDDKPNYHSILIFTSTKKKVREVTQALTKAKYNVEAVSSDLDQQQREEALRKFRSHQTRVLVATDVLSRGIDIKDINLVINYDVPGDAEDYVHRIGRTARADTTGVALTFINPDDMRRFKKIEQLIEMEVMKIPMPAEIGTGPEWNPNKRHSGGRGGSHRGRGRGGSKGRRGSSQRRGSANGRRGNSKRK